MKIKLTDDQLAKIGRAYFKEAFRNCSMSAGIKGKKFVIYITHDEGFLDNPPELKIDLDKEIRHLASGNWIAADYEELKAMVESFSRTHVFLKEYLKSQNYENTNNSDAENGCRANEITR